VLTDGHHAGDAWFFYFTVCEFVLHLARDCIDYVRRFYSFCLDVFAVAGCPLVAVTKTKH